MKNSIGLTRNAFYSIDYQESSISNSQSCGNLGIKFKVAWRVDKIYEMVFMKECYGAGLHSDTSVLLIKSIIKKEEMPCLFFINDAIGGDEAISQGSLAVVDVSYDGNISNTRSLLHQCFYLFVASLLSYHL